MPFIILAVVGLLAGGLLYYGARVISAYAQESREVAERMSSRLDEVKADLKAIKR
jgi:hypothetical protein